MVAKLLHIEIEEIDVSVTFLELGMDSLLLLEAMRIIQTTFGVKVEAQQFFEELETIDVLASYIEQNMPLEPSEKNHEENEIYPIIPQKEADLNFTKTHPQLAQTKAWNTPENSPENKAMNQVNKDMESLSKRTEKQPLPYPEWLVQAASKCVEEFAHILESEGVIVRRPDVVDYSASFRTPNWEVMNGF